MDSIAQGQINMVITSSHIKAGSFLTFRETRKLLCENCIIVIRENPNKLFFLLWKYQSTYGRSYVCFKNTVSIDFKLGIKKLVCKQYRIPQCTHLLNAPCPYIKYWPEDGSLELKHVAIYVLIDYILILCLTE